MEFATHDCGNVVNSLRNQIQSHAVNLDKIRTSDKLKNHTVYQNYQHDPHSISSHSKSILKDFLEISQYYQLDYLTSKKKRVLIEHCVWLCQILHEKNFDDFNILIFHTLIKIDKLMKCMGINFDILTSDNEED